MGCSLLMGEAVRRENGYSCIEVLRDSQATQDGKRIVARQYRIIRLMAMECLRC